MQRLFFNFVIALEAVFTNQLRAFLTALGILFGVAAVIAMLAIGEGAQKELLDQMKLIGTNNIVVKAVVDNGEENESDDGEQKRPFSPGLSLDDIENLMATVPTIEEISPEIILPISVIRNGKLKKAKCIGVENTFFELNNLDIELGSFFHASHLESGAPVCVIGKNIQAQFFNNGNPIGKQIKCGNTWLKVIGVIGKRMASKQSLTALGIRDYNSDIYVPIQTALIRVKNRALLTSKMFEKKGFVMFGSDDSKNSQGPINYHQLDRMVIRVKETDLLQSTADVVARILNRRHWEVVDYEVSVPELLIKQQQRTQDLFNYVLGAIAGISLLVGGIGIMNIMLASVLERIKEIGLRRSLGATEKDVVQQFVFEAVFISLIGGLIGVMLGVFFAHLIAQLADIPTIVTTSSIVLSFGVSATIGLIFGIVPARRAAQLDPITALRND